MSKDKKKSKKKLPLREKKAAGEHSLSALCEEHFLVVSKALKKITQTRNTSAVSQDYGYEFRKRRTKAIQNTIEEAKSHILPICGEAEGFDWQERWVEINALPITSYDLADDRLKLSLGAAFWMLDQLKAQDRLEEAMEWMPTVEELDEKTADRLEELWNPCYSNELLTAIWQVLLYRNQDCQSVKQKEVSVCQRVYMDAATIANKQHQDVPSRRRFEQIVDLIPQEVRDAAVQRFIRLFWEWVERYFRTRLLYFRREKELDDRLDRLAQQITELEEAKEEKRRQLSAQKNHLLVRPNSTDPLGLLEGKLTIQKKDEHQAMFHSLDGLYEEFHRKIEQKKELDNEISRMNFRLSLYVSGKEAAERLGQEDVEEIWKDYSITDPCELCFALLMLIDGGSELPWLYYPGLSLTNCVAMLLPWHFADYDPQEEWEGAEQTADKLPTSLEQVEQYERRFVLNDEEELGELDSDRRSFAQMLYRLAGIVLPRQLAPTQWDAEQLREMGVEEEETAQLLLTCANLLSAVKERVELLPAAEPPEEVPELEETDPTAEAEQLRERIAQMKKDCDRLKTNAYETGRSLREARKRLEEQEKAHELERQELNALRELLFAREEQQKGWKAEAEEANGTISFPCETLHRIVSFGGHDSWAREIRKKLPNVRFVERDKLPNSETIRNADMVWVQSNALSHAYYYKIIDEARRYGIPVRYFSYASAVKCAEELVKADREMG